MSKVVFIFILLISLSSFAQKSMVLQDFYDKAMENHPTGLQASELEKINHLNQKIISSSWLPDLNFNVQATYQSQVTEINIDMPGFDFPGPSHDQYRLNLEVQQMIYDAGISRKRDNLRKSSHKTEMQQIKVQVYQVLDKVNRHFFQHFIFEENMRILELTKEELTQKLNRVESGVKNGVVPVTNQWTLQAELLRLQQAVDELKLSFQSNLEVLGILTGEDLTGVVPKLPEDLEINSVSLNRPELKLFDLQKEQLYSSAQLTATATMPKIAGFAQAGYGKPGLNMLSDDFDFYYILGIRLSWDLWDWNKTSNERNIKQIRAEMVDYQQESFEQNINIALSSVMARINQLERALEKDLEIIELQENIEENTGSQLENGIITSTEYINHLNELARARIKYSERKIRLMQAIAEYNVISGN